jgi:hypothetical protein
MCTSLTIPSQNYSLSNIANIVAFNLSVHAQGETGSLLLSTS